MTEKPTETTKSPHDMTIQELQAEIGKLQSILTYKIYGDPRTCVTVPIQEGITFLSIENYPLTRKTAVKLCEKAVKL